MRSKLRPARGRIPAVESLESRNLLAAALPAGFQESVWARGLDTPTAQAFAPDGRLFVLEKAGRVRVVTPAGSLLPTSFLSVAADTAQDRGLVGLAFDPAFAANRFVYVYYTKTDTAGSRNRLSRFTASAANPNVAEAGSERVLLEVPHATLVHTGGAMGFGADGMLYLGVGDGGEASRAQDLSDLRGKVLRLNVASTGALAPADNPFVGTPGARAEIFARGLRNPFSGAMKPGTNTLYVNDVGEGAWEEVNVIARGANFGWPLVEGVTSNAAYVNPIYAYAHGSAPNSAVTGGTFYTGTQFPADYRDNYLVADYLNGWIRRLDAGGVARNFATGATGPLDLDVGPDGALYYLSVLGTGFSGADRPIYRVSYVGATNRDPAAVAVASPTSGPAPLAVSFNGAGSSDPDGDALTYLWNFGDGTPAASGRDVSHTYAVGGTFSATLTVTDGRGGSSTSAPITVSAGNRAPAATIITPAATATYAGGQTVNFSGSATDPEDGTLTAAAFRWKVLLVHNTHTHDFAEVVGATTGSFTIPTNGHVDSSQSYRIVLTVTDSAGVQHTTTRDIQPQVGNLTLQSSPAGLPLAVDAQPQASSGSFGSLVGAFRSVSAPARQTLNGVEYEFVSWSDGGAATHDLRIPAGGVALSATYRALASNQTPFGGTPAAVPGTVQAENFDEGGEGNAFHDVTAENEGGVGRTSAVDLEATTDAGGGFNVGYMKAGEWLEYTVNVSATGTYRLDLRVASLGAGGVLHAEVDGVDATGPVGIPDTGGWQAWQTVSKSGLALTAGRRVLRLAVDSEGAAGYAGNVNAFTLTRTDVPASTVMTLAPAADTYVRDGTSAGTNYATQGAMFTKTNNVGLNRQALLRFDLAGVLGTVESAKLRLFGRLENTNAVNVVTEVFGAAAGWDERTVTWNTLPAVTTGKLAGTAIADNVARWYEWDLSAYVRAERAAGRNVLSLVLKNPLKSAPYSTFNSTEAATNKPEFVVSTSGVIVPPPPPPLPVVSVTASDGTASEAGTNTGTFTFTRTGNTGQPLTVAFTLGGSASNGVDYNPLGTSVTIPAGAASAMLTLVPRDDAAVESTESAILSLTAGAAYTASSSAAAATVQIVDDDVATTPGTPGSFSAVADAYVFGGAPTSNFATASGLVVKHNASASLVRQSLFKFDLSTLAASPSSAKLRLFGQVADARAVNVPVDVYGTGAGWQESAVTWNTRSAAVTGKLATAAVVDATGRWYEWDVSAYVRTELAAGRKVVALLVTTSVATSPVLRFNSRESASNKPELVVETPPAGPAQTPFGALPIALPGLIEAEHFDNGGEGVAYHDVDAANQGGAGRAGGVDVESSTDSGGGQHVGWVRAGEWMEYTVDVAATGTYTIELRVASDHPGGTFHVEFDGVDKTGPMRLPYTGGWGVWQTVSKAGVALTAGRHVMRLAVDAGDLPGADVGNINWIRVAAPAPVQAVNWVEKAPAPLARDEAQGAAVGGTVFVFGGFHTTDFLASSRVDAYNVATNLWSARGTMPEALTHAGVAADKGAIWLVGGYLGNNPGPGTAHVWKYDTATDAWSRGPDLPAARGGGAAAVLGRKLHFFGGRDATRTTDRGEHWVLDLDNPAAGWVARAAMPNPRNHLGGAVLNGRVYAVGGQTGEAEAAVNTTLVHAYDPATDAWTRVADLPAQRSHFNAAVLVRHGRIVVVGGESAHNVSAAEVWAFDPAMNRWDAMTPLPVPRRAAVAVLAMNAIVVTGGYDGSSHHTTTWVGMA